MKRISDISSPPSVGGGHPAARRPGLHPPPHPRAARRPGRLSPLRAADPVLADLGAAWHLRDAAEPAWRDLRRRGRVATSTRVPAKRQNYGINLGHPSGEVAERLQGLATDD
ncbi:hypothetical protein EJB05_42130 [Eragrostis curvula]|uniref:Uncharacterized protein n=1 Tax=Eragrostis curvula TaxID=38414 RepID=A0A5J9TCK8_9POAL|nr:hypothetical protein EJB05_42130 [Eragrostis curvula]